MGRLILRTRLPTIAAGTPAAELWAALNATATFKAVGAPGNLQWQAYDSIKATAIGSPANMLWTADDAGRILYVSPSPVGMTWAGVNAVGVQVGDYPSTLALTGWWREYNGGNDTTGNWGGTASTGNSGSHSFSDNSGGFDKVAQGTALNGHKTALFTGIEELVASGTSLDTYFNVKGCSGWMLVKTNGPVDLLGDNGTGNFLLAYNGVSASFSVNGGVEAAKVMSDATWTLITWRYRSVSGELQIGINEVPGAAGGVSVFSYNININLTSAPPRLGQALGAYGPLLGTVAEIGLSDQALTDTNFTNVKSYINSHYGLSL